jgi:hypothetical protein
MRGAVPPLTHTSWRGTWLSTGTTLPYVTFYLLREKRVTHRGWQGGCGRGGRWEGDFSVLDKVVVVVVVVVVVNCRLWNSCCLSWHNIQFLAIVTGFLRREKGIYGTEFIFNHIITAWERNGFKKWKCCAFLCNDILFYSMSLNDFYQWRLLWTRSWTFGFHKRRRISWLAEWLSASQERLCSVELLILYNSVYHFRTFFLYSSDYFASKAFLLRVNLPQSLNGVGGSVSLPQNLSLHWTK